MINPRVEGLPTQTISINPRVKGMPTKRFSINPRAQESPTQRALINPRVKGLPTKRCLTNPEARRSASQILNRTIYHRYQKMSPPKLERRLSSTINDDKMPAKTTMGTIPSPNMKV